MMNNEEFDNELIISLAYAYLAGRSFRKLAESCHFSHVTIRKKLTEDLQRINYDLYAKVMEKVEDNTPKTIKDPDIAKRVLRAYRSLVIENKYISEIAKAENVGEFVIYRDLTKRINELHSIAPDVITDEMIENVKRSLNEHSLKNLGLDELANARS